MCRPGLRCRHTGFTLVELMVVMAVAAFLLFMATPPIASLLRTVQTRSLVGRFVTDLTWLRNQAATTQVSATGPATMTLDRQCQWAPSNVGDPTKFSQAQLTALRAAHSNSLADMPAVLQNLLCTPATLRFNTQGQLLVDAGGEPPELNIQDTVYNTSWILQIATSGSILVTVGQGTH